MLKSEIEARFVPDYVAVCPICGNRIWIEDICEVSRENDLSPWLPEQISITCEEEPDIDSNDWKAWHKWHFRNPYTDWLPVEQKILKWLIHPSQTERVNLLWASDFKEATDDRSCS